MGGKDNLYKEWSQLQWCERPATVKKNLEIHENPSSLEALPKLREQTKMHTALKKMCSSEGFCLPI